MSPLILPATPEDARGIARVKIASWQAAYRGLMPQDYLDQLDLELMTERFQSWMSDPASAGEDLILRWRGNTVGWGHLVSPARGSAAESRDGELVACYLLPDCWGRGWGRLLLKASMRQLAAAGAERCLVWLLRDNQRARSFYERQGFRADGLEKPLLLRPGCQLMQERMSRPIAAPQLDVRPDRGGRSGG